MFAPKVIYDKVFRISAIKLSEMLVNLDTSSLSRFPLKTAWPPNDCNSQSKKYFHLPWLSGSRYFFTHVVLSALLHVEHFNSFSCQITNRLQSGGVSQNSLQAHIFVVQLEVYKNWFMFLSILKKAKHI